MKYIEHIWEACRYKKAFIELFRFIEHLETEGGELYTNHPMTGSKKLNVQDELNQPNAIPFNDQTDLVYAHIAPDYHFCPEAINKVLSRAYFKQGQWEEFLFSFNANSIPEILKSYRISTEKDTKWYKAWHTWAFMNFRALKFCKDNVPELRKKIDFPLTSMGKYGAKLNPREFAINAIKGFFKSVAFCKNGSSLQDTLRILTIWFDDGHDEQIRAAVEEGIKSVSIDTWLQVIPQLIARIDMPHTSVAKLIHTLLTDIGKYHPQSLIYPLTVTSKSTNIARSNAANEILHLMRVHSPNLVKQAILVSEELIRIAILWHELWHEGLEEASRLYFGDNNIDAMFETLEPLHKMIERAPSTFKELSFYQSYGQDLAKAYQFCQ